MRPGLSHFGLAILAIRSCALLLLVDAIQQLSSLAGVLEGATLSGLGTIMILFVLMPALTGLVLFALAPWLAGRFVAGIPEAASASVSDSDDRLPSVAFAAVGLFIVAQYAPQIAYATHALVQEQSAGPPAGAGSQVRFWAAVATTGFGACLFLGARFWQRCYERVREFGL